MQPTDEELQAWHTKCADLTRQGKAGHYWAFDVSGDNVSEIAHAALDRWGNTSPQQPRQDKPDRLIALDRSGSLVERVAGVFGRDYADQHEAPDDWSPEARAAIREVAAWLREQDPEPGPVGRWLGQISTPCTAMADELEHKASL